MIIPFGGYINWLVGRLYFYNGHQTYWGHDPDLSRSRDVIGHVTIGLAMVRVLLVVLWTQVSISNGFRDIPPQTSCA